jgi:GTP cyclohydrolase I
VVDQQRMDLIAEVRNAISSLCLAIEDDPEREGLIETPRRVADMWLEMLKPKPFTLSKFPNPGYDEMIVQRDIEFVSMCEHHLLPFVGMATVAYVPAPDGFVIGLSKLARIVDWFAAGLQLQERLTCEIAEHLQTELQPLGVGVVIEAKHMCMSVRGVKKRRSRTTTSHLTGVFRDKPETRAEFLKFVPE